MHFCLSKVVVSRSLICFVCLLNTNFLWFPIRVFIFFTFCEKLSVYWIYSAHINTKVQYYNSFSKILSSSYSGVQLKIFPHLEKYKARKEIFAPNDSETQVSYLLVIHLLALSQSKKKDILEKRYFHA